MRPRILWVEDSARLELRSLIGPILYEGRYGLDLAEDVTTASRLTTAGKFDAMIVDLRLPPGADQTWRELYRAAGMDKVHAQLGLRLLEWLLRAPNSPRSRTPAPAWITPKHINVFTVESWNEIGNTLTNLGIAQSQFTQKTASLPDTILLSLCDNLVSHAGAV